MARSGAKVLPAKVVVWCAGVELSLPCVAPGGGADEAGRIDLEPLRKYRCGAGATGPTLEADSRARQARCAISVALARAGRFRRCTDEPQPVHLSSLPHKRLTRPAPLWQVDLQALLDGASLDDAVTLATSSSPASSSASSSSDTAEEFVREGAGGGLMIQQCALADGRLDATILWHELHLSSSTTSPSSTAATVVMAPLGAASLHDGAAAIAPAAGPWRTRSCGGKAEEQAVAVEVHEVPSLPAVLLHTERELCVRRNGAVQLVAQRAGGPRGAMRVDVRPSRGVAAPRPPWKVRSACAAPCLARARLRSTALGWRRGRAVVTRALVLPVPWRVAECAGGVGRRQLGGEPPRAGVRAWAVGVRRDRRSPHFGSLR